MRENFEKYVDQITQNVTALLNIWKIQIRIRVIGQWKSKNRVALSNRVRCVWTFSWKGPIKINWTTFTIFLRLLFQLVGWFDEVSCMFWVQTLLKEISTRESSSNWLGQVYVRLTIRESFVKRLLQHAATWNNKWSKILSIVWFHGQYVAFVHLLINIDDCF
jgi:hypothetical protein